MVSADLPTPPPPTTTSLYSLRKLLLDILRGEVESAGRSRKRKGGGGISKLVPGRDRALQKTATGGRGEEDEGGRERPDCREPCESQLPRRAGGRGCLVVGLGGFPAVR